jgi:hypothetical protein
VQQRYEWRNLVGLVHPASGRTVFPLATLVSIPLFEAELAALAHTVAASPTKQIVLVLDRAGWRSTQRAASGLSLARRRGERAQRERGGTHRNAWRLPSLPGGFGVDTLTAPLTHFAIDSLLGARRVVPRARQPRPAGNLAIGDEPLRAHTH